MPSTGDALLRDIDSKLSALLALTVDRHLRDTGVAKPKERSIDQMLSDVGLGAAEISRLLGKTERAVHLSLQKGREKKTTAKKKASRGSAKA
jgi:DNA-directed RNA polymerase specialized sigma24 family protein